MPEVIELPNGLRIGLVRSRSDLGSFELDLLALTLAPFPVTDRRVIAVADLDESLALIEKTALECPIASMTACEVLRANASATVSGGLLVESLAYSMLQAGPEFQRWLGSRQCKTLAIEPDPVRVARQGDVLSALLDRPQKHNALNRAMRDSLLEALALAALCPEVSVELRGHGPSFCSGGDLDEFGLFLDPATAHIVRIELSIGARLAPIAHRVTAYVHGAVGGSGLELAAFCGKVVAEADAQFFLPELGLGLIPGAGGTVSVNRRIGRWRTAFLLLTGAHLDAATAAEWGLVDELA